MGIAESTAFAIMMALAAYLGRENPLFVYPEILWSFLALLSFNLINFTMLSDLLPARDRAQIAVFINVLLISVIVHYSGGYESYFWVMYLLPIFASALVFRWAGISAALTGILALMIFFYSSSIYDRIWAEILEMAIKMLTLLTSAGMTFRVVTAERRARLQLDQEQERVRRERVEMRERLQSIDRLMTLGTLSAGIAHELNGPLANILGFVETAPRIGIAEEVKWALGRIEFNAKLCRDIVHNTLAFARTRGTNRAVSNLNGLARQCVELKNHDWAGGSVRIEENYDQTLRPTSVNGAEIQQVVFNLLANAEHAVRSCSDSDGLIQVRTAADVDRIRIEIEDNGPGIPPEILAKIWEPFFTTKPVGQGTGLGLSISKNIAENHGGKLRVESQPGRTIFTLELPAATA